MPKHTPGKTLEVTNARDIDEDESPPSFDYDATATETDDALGFYSLEDTGTEINALWYGREGTGKTTDIAAAANVATGKVLIVNAEAGTKVVALKRRGIDTSQIVLWPARGQKVTFRGLVALHQRLLADLTDDPESWYAVAFDSVTEITAALREQATEARQDRLTSQNRQFDENFVDIADYGVMTDQLRRIFRRFRDLPCHFLATALEKKDETAGTVGPDLTPSLASALMGYVDLVLYVRTDVEAPGEEEADHGAEFRALTRANTKYRAKDRFDSTPKVLANPDFPRVLAYIEGDLDEGSDAAQQGYLERQAERQAAIDADKEARKQRRQGGGKR